jgi:hypothetical protein
MEKTKQGPVPANKTHQEVERFFDRARRMQEAVDKLGAGRPKFVQGTIEPEEKK